MFLVSVYEMEAQSMANNFLSLNQDTCYIKHMRIFKGVIRLIYLKSEL